MPGAVKTLSEHLAEVEARGEALRRRSSRAVRALTGDDRKRLSDRADAILRDYQGVDSQGAIAGPGGAVFDAIPVEQQAALKRSGAPVAAPVDMPGAAAAGDPPAGARAGLGPAGTVPLRRPDLDDALRTKGHEKAPPPAVAGGAPDAPSVPAGVNYHRYALYGSANGTTNVGGFAYHGAWQEPIDAVTKSQWFSLNQQWFLRGTQSVAGTSGTLSDPFQTVEFGLQCMPRVWGGAGPSLFIFTTRDGYGTDSHYHGLTGSPFVQTSNAWAAGMDVAPLCALSGQQRFVGLGAMLTGGNWWIYAGGRTAADAIGYYPASWWGGAAPAMAQSATRCEWGGEVSTDTLATPPAAYFPRMGSGRYSTRGFRGSAYIRDIQYYPTAATQVIPPAPTGDGNSNTIPPGAFRLYADGVAGFDGTVNGYAKPWNRTFWYGGPGGTMNTDTGVVTINAEP